MAGAKYEHIFLDDKHYERRGYVTPRSSRSKAIPRRSVADHSHHLRCQLDQAWQEARQLTERRQAIALPTRSGAYIEFRSDIGAELVSKSLEDRR